VHVLEDEDGRRLVGEALEEDAPGREEVLLIARRRRIERKEMREARLDPLALVVVGDVLGEGRAQLLARRGGLLVLGDQAAHPHHFGECPVRDTVAVGEAAASVPPDVLREAVDVLLELPREA
jgi:hypothetical protein